MTQTPPQSLSLIDPRFWAPDAQEATNSFQENNNTNGNKRKPEIQKNKNENQVNTYKKFFQGNTTSYVKTKTAKRGLRLIQINVFDLSSQGSHSELFDSDQKDGDLISAQYIVVDKDDDIMAETELLVNKISRQLCDNIYTF